MIHIKNKIFAEWVFLSRDPYLAYDQMIKFREIVDILIPLHEPSFSSVETIP